MIKKKSIVKLSKNYSFLMKSLNILFAYSLHFRIDCCKSVITFFFDKLAHIRKAGFHIAAHSMSTNSSDEKSIFGSLTS